MNKVKLNTKAWYDRDPDYAQLFLAFAAAMSVIFVGPLVGSTNKPTNGFLAVAVYFAVFFFFESHPRK